MKFEDKMKELQSIADKMEDSNLPMDEAIALYEKGSELAKECFAVLNETKGKITVIKQDLDKYKEENFE